MSTGSPHPQALWKSFSASWGLVLLSEPFVKGSEQHHEMTAYRNTSQEDVVHLLLNSMLVLFVYASTCMWMSQEFSLNTFHLFKYVCVYVSVYVCFVSVRA